jgi:hypothetical protein
MEVKKMKTKHSNKEAKLRLLIKRILITAVFLDLAWFLFLPLGRTNTDIIGWFNSSDFITCVVILVIIAAVYPLVSGKYRFTPPQHTKEKQTDETRH